MLAAPFVPASVPSLAKGSDPRLVRTASPDPLTDFHGLPADRRNQSHEHDERSRPTYRR